MSRAIDIGLPGFDREAELLSMRQKMDALKTWFPSPEAWADAETEVYRAYDNVKIPAHARLLDPHDPGTLPLRKAALQRLVDLVPAVAANRPVACPYAVVQGRVEWPFVFHSEICVCFSPEKAEAHSLEYYGQRQESGRKTYQAGSWVEVLPDAPMPFEITGITLPEGVEIGGYAARKFDPRMGEIIEEQTWSVRATAPAVQGVET